MRFTLLILSILFFHASSAQTNEANIDGNWYLCLANGHYEEYQFKDNKVIMTRNLNSWEHKFELNNDSIINIMEGYYDWAYRGVISRNESKSELKMSVIPSNNLSYLNQARLVQFNAALLEHSFKKRKRIHGCYDIRSKEQKETDDLIEEKMQFRIFQLEQRLDSLVNVREN